MAHRAFRWTCAVVLTGAMAACSSSDSSSPATDSVPTTDTAASVTTVADTTPTTQPPTEQTAPATDPAATDATQPPTTEATCVVDSDAEPKISGEPLTISPLVGTDIVASSATCADTITVRFSGDLQDPAGFPGWSVEYVDEPAPTVGAAVLLVTVGAMMPNDAGEGYTGPTEIFPTDASHILRMTQVANIDGSSTWAIELDAVLPFDVAVPDGPPRIVIELQTGS